MKTIKHIDLANRYESVLIDPLIRKHKVKYMNLPNKNKQQTHFVSAVYGTMLNNIIRTQMAKNDIIVSFWTDNKLPNLLKQSKNIKLAQILANSWYVQDNICKLL